MYRADAVVATLIVVILVAAAMAQSCDMGRWQCVNFPADSECQALKGKHRP